MSIEDTIGCRDEGETCVVCGKGLRPGEALATMHQDGRKLPICCPLCLEAYQNDPKPYLERMAKRALSRELNKPESTPPKRSPLDE
jgi:ribosomal protein L24E